MDPADPPSGSGAPRTYDVLPISLVVVDSGRPLRRFNGVSEEGTKMATAHTRMNDGYVTVEVDGGKWNIHVEDWDHHLAQVTEDKSIRYDEVCRRVVALCHGWGRRITPALA